MLDYDHMVDLLELYEDGCFYNRQSRGAAKVDKRAGFQDVHGYRRIMIDGKKYYEHHLVWFWVHGEWPHEIDHIDGDRSNNAPTNLRLCDRSQNNCNSQSKATGQSGLRGAYLDKRTTRWYSHIQFGGQVMHLGMFDTPLEAHLAYEEAAERLHGDFYMPPTHLNPQNSKDSTSWALSVV